MMLRLLAATLLLLALLSGSSHAFPDHLQGGSGCMTDLSTDEVIMNAQVLSLEDSIDPDVKVVGYKTTPEEQHDELLKTDAVIEIDAVPASFHFQLTNPNMVTSIQYVIDLSGTGARWEYGDCKDSKRATGKGDETVNTLIVDEMPSAPIKVWAGWARGHSAVSLTNVIELRPVGNSRDQLIRAAVLLVGGGFIVAWIVGIVAWRRNLNQKWQTERKAD